MNIQSDIAAARAKLEQAQNELRALEERAKQEARKPWEPKGGDYYLHPIGDVRYSAAHGDARIRISGSDYPTQQAAESAIPYVTFFKRLCCLAQELNPSGRVGGTHGLLNDEGTWKRLSAGASVRDLLCLFETKDAANRAAEIMNRDGWTVPSL